MGAGRRSRRGHAKGDLKFILHGERLQGKWVLVRMRPKSGESREHENWLLSRRRDEYAGQEKKPIIDRALTSVRTGRTMEEIAAGNVEWAGGQARKKSGRRHAGEDKRAADGRGGGDRRAAAAEVRAPQLATLAEAPPSGGDWLHEIKYDGYRAIAAVAGGKARIFTRTGLDWTDRFRAVVQPLADLPCRSALLDGEAVVRRQRGPHRFRRAAGWRSPRAARASSTTSST